MDPSYEKYGKSVSKDFTESFNSNHDDSDVIHIHDIAHNIKNAEASLERWTHFDGETVYNSSDITVWMANLDGEHDQWLNNGTSHCAVLQFDKQIDELSLQRISSQVIDSCKEVGQQIKTEVSEIRRIWFADSHENIGCSGTYLLAADLGFKSSIRVFQGSMMLRNQRKLLPISKLCSLPNMGLVVRTLTVQKKPSLVPCGISEIVSSNLLIVTDPVNETVEVLDMSSDCSTRMCISKINSNLFEHPFDCISVAPDKIAITYLSKDDGKVHIIHANKKCIAYSLEELTCRFLLACACLEIE
eukprot:gene15899-7231_t